MTIEEMKNRKKELGYTNVMISQETGIPLSTVQKIFSGSTQAPRRETILALEKLLKKKSPEENSGKPIYNSVSIPPDTIHEAELAYGGKRGQYTIDDYYALPEERRVELIDGVFYDMAAPTFSHQAVLGALHLEFARCAAAHPECRVFFAPADVRLDRDNKTMLQPDLMVICEGDTTGAYYDGAPDLTLEVLSPSTRAKDMFLKLAKYKVAGVREYWTVDIDKQLVTVYDLEHDEGPVTYTFEDVVPVRISHGECSIDFREVRKQARL